MDPKPLRRTGKPRSDRFSQKPQYRNLSKLSRRPDVSPRIDRLPERLPPDLSRRPRFRLQMGYGLDARHDLLHLARPDSPKIPPHRAHYPNSLRVFRKFRDANLP